MGLIYAVSTERDAVVPRSAALLHALPFPSTSLLQPTSRFDNPFSHAAGQDVEAVCGVTGDFRQSVHCVWSSGLL
jgi:hypothetical protein